MIRFFNFLNISQEEQNKLPQDILDGGKLIDGMQLIYEEITNERKRDVMAHTIAEMSSILLKRLNEYKLNPKAKENIEEEIKEIEQVQDIQEVQVVETPLSDDGKNIDEKRLFLEHIRKDILDLEF
jgi:gamma-glutamyl phosphate reductase